MWMHCPRHAAAVPHFCTVTDAIPSTLLSAAADCQDQCALHAPCLVLHLIPKLRLCTGASCPFKCPPLWRGPAYRLLSVCRIHRQKPPQFRQKQCRIMAIFAMTKKCYPQNEISIYILIRIKIIIKNENKRRFILIRIKMRIIIDIKMCIRITIIILIRIIINIKIRLDTMS